MNKWPEDDARHMNMYFKATYVFIQGKVYCVEDFKELAGGLSVMVRDLSNHKFCTFTSNQEIDWGIPPEGLYYHPRVGLRWLEYKGQRQYKKSLSKTNAMFWNPVTGYRCSRFWEHPEYLSAVFNPKPFSLNINDAFDRIRKGKRRSAMINTDFGLYRDQGSEVIHYVFRRWVFGNDRDGLQTKNQPLITEWNNMLLESQE